MEGQLAQKLTEATAAMAATPAHGDAQEGGALPRRRFDQLEAVAAEAKGSTLGQQQSTPIALLLDDLHEAPVAGR